MYCSVSSGKFKNHSIIHIPYEITKNVEFFSIHGHKLLSFMVNAKCYDVISTDL